MENLVWALIVVSSTANVSFSTGYPTEGACKDALSIARTGRTVAEEEEAARRADKAREQRLAEYQARNPPRPSTPQDEKRCYGLEFLGMDSSAPFCVRGSDGQTRFFGPSLGLTMSVGGPTITYARCVQVPRDSK